MERHTRTNIIHHFLNDIYRLVVLASLIFVAANAQPVNTRHDDASAENTTHAVVVHDAGERYVIVYVLFARPLFREGEVVRRGNLVYDADGAVFPFRGQRGVPLGEVAVDHLGEVKNLLGFGFVGGVVRSGGEGVCTRAEAGQIDAD
jgi:hypothetical protein